MKFLNLTTALNSLPESAGLWVVPVAAHEPHDEEEGGHDEGEGEGEGKVLDLHLAGELGKLVGDEGGEDLQHFWSSYTSHLQGDPSHW